MDDSLDDVNAQDELMIEPFSPPMSDEDDMRRREDENGKKLENGEDELRDHVPCTGGEISENSEDEFREQRGEMLENSEDEFREGENSEDHFDEGEEENFEDRLNEGEEGEEEQLENHPYDGEEGEEEEDLEDHPFEGEEEKSAETKADAETQEADKENKATSNTDTVEDLGEDGKQDEEAAKAKQGKSKGKKASSKLGEQRKVDSESDSDIGISKGEAWRLRVAKGKGTGKFAKVEDTEDHAGKESKSPGHVKKWISDKRFGFISRPSGGDLFFHFSSVRTFVDYPRAARFHAANEGRLQGVKVKFKAETLGGREKAKWVKITDEKWLSEFENWEEPSWWDIGAKGAGKGSDVSWYEDENAKRKAPANEDSGDAPKLKSARAEDEPEPTSVPGWINAQERLFGHLSQLPENWIRMRSRSSGKIYFYNHKTGASQHNEPI